MSKKTEPKEALKVLKDRIHYSLYELNEATKNDTHSRLIRSIRVLDELVDKATPKKPNNYQKYSSDSDAWGKCPDCNKDVCDYADKYCPNCSKAIDWSEND